jgi:hypothetical protein
MTAPSMAGLGLRLRVALLHASPLMLAAAVVFLAVAGALGWTTRALWTLEQREDRFVAQAKATRLAAQAAGKAGQAAAPVPAAPPQVVDNLDAFYGALGEQRHAEQQVKTLFGLAAQSGLMLRQGEYKAGYDRNAGVATYQVNLPVKGSYAAIWQFAMGALRAIPFASLDDISFRRDAIGDPAVEARLRLTLYLRDGAAKP